MIPMPSPVHHTLSCRVYYADTDAGNVVYHASYLQFAERARTEWLRALGFDHKRLREEYNLIFAVRHIAVDYQAPARLDDELEIATQLIRIGGAALDMRQVVMADEKVLTTIDVTVVAITPDGKVLRLPPQLCEVLAGAVG